MAALRSRAADLYEPGVELPSDISGLLYKELTGNWPCLDGCVKERQPEIPRVRMEAVQQVSEQPTPMLQLTPHLG